MTRMEAEKKAADRNANKHLTSRGYTYAAELNDRRQQWGVVTFECGLAIATEY